MEEIVISGTEKDLTCVEFQEHASEAPHVACLGPAIAQDDLWGAVLARVYEGRVLFHVVDGAAEVDDFDVEVLLDARLRRGVLPLLFFEEDVLGLEVRVRVAEAVDVVEALEAVLDDLLDGLDVEALDLVDLHAIEKRKAELGG